MNNRYTLAALVACCVACCFACCVAINALGAQSSMRPPPRPRTRARPAMWVALQLTDSQKASVAAIHKKYLPAMKVAKKLPSDSGSRVFQNEMREVRTLLTFSQQEMFDTYMNSDGRWMRHEGVSRVVPAKVLVPH